MCLYKWVYDGEGPRKGCRVSKGVPVHVCRRRCTSVHMIIAVVVVECHSPGQNLFGMCRETSVKLLFDTDHT